MNADHVAVSVSIGFPQTQMGILLCTTQYLFEYSNANLKSFQRRFMVLTWFHEYLSNCVFPAVAWLMFSDVFCCPNVVFFNNVIVNDSATSNYFFRFLVRLKDIIGSPSNVLPNSLFFFQNRPLLFHNLGDVWGRSVVRYCQRHTNEITAILDFLR